MPFIDTYPDDSPASPRASRLSFVLDILPAGLTDLKREVWLPRLKVDGTEILVRSATVDDSESAAGKTLTVELLKVSDRTVFTSSASIDFGIGRKVAGAWDATTFKTLITAGKVLSVDRRIAGPPQNPQDTVTVQIISPETEKLNKTSANGLVIYDPDREDLNPSDIRTIYDAQGNAYTPEVIAIPGLTLADLFQKVFVTKCGFSSYSTTLPAKDYPIQRYQVGMGQRYYDGLKGLIGMFSPAVRVTGNAIAINDSTIVQPSGFPQPKAVTVDKVTSIDASTEKQRLDALLVKAVGLENNYDFTTLRFDYPTTSDGSVRTESEKITIEFRKIAGPSETIVSEALNIETKKTFAGGVQIDESSDVYEFDAFGRPNNRRKTVQKRMPPLSDVTLTPTLQKVLEEHEYFGYAANPFKPRTQYLQIRELRRSGVYSIDADNPLPDGTPFKQEITLGQHSGNIRAGQTFGDGSMRYRSESAEPLRDGQTRVRVLEIDELNGVVVEDYQETRPGEISIIAGKPTEITMPVFASDGASRSFDRVEDFPIGELPLKFGLPLARRVLQFRQTKGQQIRLEHIGYDESLVKGTTIAAFDRVGLAIGVVLITGTSIRITREGLVMSLSTRELADSAEPLSNIGPYARTIDASQVLSFTVPVECALDLYLFVDPSPVADLTIEARHVELPAAGWTNIETTPLNLSTWTGTTQNFEIRITAGSVSSVTSHSFDIVAG